MSDDPKKISLENYPFSPVIEDYQWVSSFDEVYDHPAEVEQSDLDTLRGIYQEHQATLGVLTASKPQQKTALAPKEKFLRGLVKQAGELLDDYENGRVVDIDSRMSAGKTYLTSALYMTFVEKMPDVAIANNAVALRKVYSLPNPFIDVSYDPVAEVWVGPEQTLFGQGEDLAFATQAEEDYFDQELFRPYKRQALDRTIKDQIKNGFEQIDGRPSTNRRTARRQLQDFLKSKPEKPNAYQHLHGLKQVNHFTVAVEASLPGQPIHINEIPYILPKEGYFYDPASDTIESLGDNGAWHAENRDPQKVYVVPSDSPFIDYFTVDLDEQQKNLVRQVRFVVFKPFQHFQGAHGGHIIPAIGLSFGDGHILVTTTNASGARLPKSEIATTLAHEARHVYDTNLPPLIGEWIAFEEQYKAQIAQGDQEAAKQTLENLKRAYYLDRFPNEIFWSVYPESILNVRSFIGHVKHPIVSPAIFQQLTILDLSALPTEIAHEFRVVGQIGAIVMDSRQDKNSKYRQLMVLLESNDPVVQWNAAGGLEMLFPDLFLPLDMKRASKKGPRPMLEVNRNNFVLKSPEDVIALIDYHDEKIQELQAGEASLDLVAWHAEFVLKLLDLYDRSFLHAPCLSVERPGTSATTRSSKVDGRKHASYLKEVLQGVFKWMQNNKRSLQGPFAKKITGLIKDIDTVQRLYKKKQYAQAQKLFFDRSGERGTVQREIKRLYQQGDKLSPTEQRFLSLASYYSRLMEEYGIVKFVFQLCTFR